MKIKLNIALGIIFFIANLGTVNAAPLVLSNPSQFSGGETLITFDGLGSSNSLEISSINGVGFTLLQVNTLTSTGFAPTLASAPNSTYAREFAPNDGPFFLSTISSDQNAPLFADLRITLPGTANRIGMEIRSGQAANLVDDLSFEFYLGNTLVEQYNSPIRGQENFFFYGFESTLNFDSWVIRQSPDSRFGLENLRFEPVTVASVPEPSGLILLCSGILGMSVYLLIQKNSGCTSPSGNSA